MTRSLRGVDGSLLSPNKSNNCNYVSISVNISQTALSLRTLEDTK